MNNIKVFYVGDSCVYEGPNDLVKGCTAKIVGISQTFGSYVAILKFKGRVQLYTTGIGNLRECAKRQIFTDREYEALWV